MAVKYKMVNSDFDSTLTNSRGEVSERTRAAIKRYISNGGIFLVNTGRSYKSLIPRLKEVYGDDISYPVACLQGCMIHLADGKLSYNITMDKRDVIRLAQSFESLGEYFQVYSGDRLFAEKRTEWSEGYANATNTEQEFVGKLSEFLRGYDGEVDKVLLISNPETVSTHFASYVRVDDYPNTKFVYSTSYFLEAIPLAAGKDIALAKFAKMYGIDISQTAAVGDSNNDIPMVKLAGCGVAMGNGVEELKGVADFVTGDTDDDGLAEFLESIIL